MSDEQPSGERTPPDVDAILRELQRRHGGRVVLSPALVARLEEARSAEAARAQDAGSTAAAAPVTICILCDTSDYCNTCDALDFCWGNDMQ